MGEAAADLAILGSSPLAALLAGLLAAEHGRSVWLVGGGVSPFRLRRQFDLSVAPLTRPETLVLLRTVAAETQKLLAGLGKGLLDRVDPLFVAETPSSMAALGHFRHVANALGITVEPHADRSLAEGGAIARVRDAQLVSHARLGAALAPWLEAAGVRRFERSLTRVTVRRDGSVRLAAGGREFEAAHAVLADDEAILSYLPEDARDRSLVPVPTAAFLTQPARSVPGFAQFLDRGVVAHNAGRAGVAALVFGDPATAPARLGSVIARSGPLQRAGEARFGSLATSDGAPILATAKGGKATLVAGFGLTGAFLAPAVARAVAGGPAGEEAGWFAARGASRGNLRQDVSDYAPAVPA